MSKSLTAFVLFLLVGGAVGAYVAIQPHDDSDPPGGRSDLSIRIDALTGCQYLSAGWRGGLTPRLDRDGHQICGASQ
jgi:hypothetical protein